MISGLNYLCLVPARIVLEQPNRIPDDEGLYYVFIEGGERLLRATSYFRFSRHKPLAHKRAVHVYTGATTHLRDRLRCHLHGGAEGSGLRKTLVSIERARKAISATKTSGCPIIDKRTLDKWMAQNVYFAFIPCRQALRQELRVLRTTASPLNIRNALVPEYAQQLLRWRRQHFLHDGCF